jgi:hypothetical protein
MIGGMVGNKSCGDHSLIYGAHRSLTRDYSNIKRLAASRIQKLSRRNYDKARGNQSRTFCMSNLYFLSDPEIK